MAWLNGTRTVYCQHCGTKGHNRRTCPEIPQHVKEAQASVSSRACSWCRLLGHDVRHCEVRANEFQSWYQANARLRRIFFDDMTANGVFPGAIGATSMGVHKNQLKEIKITDIPAKYLMMVEKIHWDRVLEYDNFPAPKRISWRKRQRMKHRLYSEHPIELVALAEPENYDYDPNYVARRFVTASAWGPNESYWSPTIKILLTGAGPKWEDLPEDWRNGISGTEKLWAKKK